MKKKHAIIIGAMKSGTTSLFTYLAQHQEICPSNPKEINFFSDPQKRKESIEEYLKYWDCNNQSVLLEASPNYAKFPDLPNVAQSIMESEIDPFLIYIVRNPIDRIRSHYNHSIYRNRPSKVLDQFYLDVSDYYLQLEQYKEYFPKEKFLVIDFDELVNNTQNTLNEVFQFLELEPIQLEDLQPQNTTDKKFSRVTLKRIFSKSEPVIELSKRERETILQSLKSNMIKFGKEYHFDIKKWGF